MSFMKQFIVSTLLILGVVSFMVILAGGNYRARSHPASSLVFTAPRVHLRPRLLVPALLPYVNAVLLFLIIIEMKS